MPCPIYTAPCPNKIKIKIYIIFFFPFTKCNFCCCFCVLRQPIVCTLNCAQIFVVRARLYPISFAPYPLETRRIRGDQIEVFKIMHGYEGLNKDMFFRIKNDSITRGHSLALVKSHSRLDIRKYTFSQRVVNDWNKLPEECINATSVNMFKNKIDQYYLKTRRE